VNPTGARKKGGRSIQEDSFLHSEVDRRRESMTAAKLRRTKK